MTGGGCHARKRVCPAPLGFGPFQRLRYRKSTHPGFPSPGMFPSRRFSRPQGFAPSGPLWACSIPLTLLGFRLEGLEAWIDTPFGACPQPESTLCPPERPEGRQRSAPHGGTSSRRVQCRCAGGQSPGGRASPISVAWPDNQARHMDDPRDGWNPYPCLS